MFKRHYLKNQKRFLKFSLGFCSPKKSSTFSKKKDQLHSLNISEVIDSEKCGYLNAEKLLL